MTIKERVNQLKFKMQEDLDILKDAILSSENPKKFQVVFGKLANSQLELILIEKQIVLEEKKENKNV